MDRKLIQKLALKILDVTEITNFVPECNIFEGDTAPNLAFSLNSNFVSKTKDLF